MCQSEKGELKVFKISACRKCEQNNGKAVEQEEKLFNEVEAARELIYLGHKVSAGGGCKCKKKM